MNRALIVLSLSLSLSTGCTTKDGSTSSDPLTFEEMAGGVVPLDATPNSDASVLYFIGMPDGVPTLGKVVPGSDPETILSGDPLVAPQSLSISPDDQTIYVADPAAGGDGAVFAFGNDGTLNDTLAQGQIPEGVHATATGFLFTGMNADSQPGVFEYADSAVSEIASGAPFSDPNGVVQTTDGSVYVTDTPGTEGAGMVIAVSGGTASVLADSLWLADPAGISATTDNSTLVVSAHSPDTGDDEVLLMSPQDGTYTSTNAGIEGNVNGGGVHRAATTDIWAWADLTAGSAGTVYRVSFK